MRSRPSKRWLGAAAITVGALFVPATANPPASPPPADPFDRARFLTPSSTIYENNPAERHPQTWAFFAPAPPPLGTELRELPPLGAGPPAPAGAAPFVGDLFYPLLAARLAASDLPAPLRDRLESYRAAKRSLQEELRAAIAGARSLDPSVRVQRLTEYSAAQSPRIVELEKTAEKLRLDLQGSNVLGGPVYSADWDLSTCWDHPPTEATATSLAQEARAVRGAAYFQAGLLPSQRRLLLDLAADKDAQADAAQSAGRAAADDWPVSFAPAGARFRIVRSLPASLAAKISDYTAQKAGLQAELLAALRATVHQEPDAREREMARLASAQTPVLARLEVAADAIRAELTLQPEAPGPPAPPALPAELANRLSTYHAHKVEVLRTLYDALARANPRPDPPAQPTAIADHTPEWLQGAGGATPVSVSGLRVSIDEFNQLQLELIGRLNRELAGLRVALTEYARSTARGGQKSVDDLLTDFERARRLEENWEKYRDYESAMLQPGLSPEQRRLLFDFAVQELRLPLPVAANID